MSIDTSIDYIPRELCAILDLSPLCAVCNRPVDSIEQHEDFLKNQFIWIARCHGDTEEVRLNVEELRAIRSNRVRMGVAFQRKQLDGQTDLSTSQDATTGVPLLPGSSGSGGTTPPVG